MDLLNNEDKPYEHIEAYYYLDYVGMRKKRTGEDYLLLCLYYREEPVFGFVWNNPMDVAHAIPERTIVKVTGITKNLNGSPVIHTGRIEPAPLNEIPLRDFVWCVPEQPSPGIEKLLLLIDSITNPSCRSLIASFLLDREFVEAFISAPGGQWIHNAYERGLMEHTVSVMEFALWVVEHNPGILNRDLILTGAFLHDIGKTREFQRGNREFRYSLEGRLVRHISIGCNMVQDRIAGLPGFSRDLALHIDHMILSHHGHEEYGSPVRPQTPEAVALHIADSFDVRINHLVSFVKGVDPEREWSDFDKILKTALYMKRCV